MNDKQKDGRNDMFDSAVREQLTGYEPQVPHALWNRISAALDNEGETFAETAPEALHHTTTNTNRWKYAAAAAVLLTLTVSTLLYTLNPTNATFSTSAPVASAPVTAPAVTTPTKTVALVKPAIHKVVRLHKTATVQTTATAQNTAPAPVQTNTDNKPETATNTNDQALAALPVTTENKPVEVGNIPLASLNFLSTPSNLNDEITVIKSVEKKKKHGKHDESTKVILLGKKFDSKPNIVYQVPARF